MDDWPERREIKGRGRKGRKKEYEGVGVLE